MNIGIIRQETDAANYFINSQYITTIKYIKYILFFNYSLNDVSNSAGTDPLQFLPVRERETEKFYSQGYLQKLYIHIWNEKEIK